MKIEGFGAGASLGWEERGGSAELLAMSLCSSQAAGALAFGGVWGAWVGSLVSNKGCAHLAALTVCRESAKGCIHLAALTVCRTVPVLCCLCKGWDQ